MQLILFLKNNFKHKFINKKSKRINQQYSFHCILYLSDYKHIVCILVLL